MPNCQEFRVSSQQDLRKVSVVLPGARPGDVFDYEEQANGQFLLVRLQRPKAARKMSPEQVRTAIRKSKLKFDLTWEELRAWTREPFTKYFPSVALVTP